MRTDGSGIRVINQYERYQLRSSAGEIRSNGKEVIDGIVENDGPKTGGNGN